MNRIRFLARLGLLVATVMSRPAPGREIIVAAAASMRSSLEEIDSLYLKESGNSVKLVTGSSGKLCAQISQGAPYDAFVSADAAYPESLSVWGLTVEQPRLYALGTLVAWCAAADSITPDLAWLGHPRIRSIAIADPRLAPYGRQAMLALERSGILPTVQGKLIIAENIGQVAQYMATHSVDAALCAKSCVMAGDASIGGVWIDVPPLAYEKCRQTAVVIRQNDAGRREAAKTFLLYLQYPPARRILARHGFELPDSTTR